MEILQAIILGVVQGLTEFLPISSTAHLILIPNFFGWTGVVDTLSFDVALHMGTAAAVLLFFWQDWLKLVSAFLKNLGGGWDSVWKNQDSKLFILLIIGSIPAGIIGYLLQDEVAGAFRKESLLAFMLIFFSLILYWADRVGTKNRTIGKIALSDSVLIGFSQAIALIPGVSRSGVTITAGLFRGLDREAATRFSFLLSTPIIVSASLFSLKDIIGTSINGDWGVFLAGFCASAISGFLVIGFLLRFVKNNNFNFFVIYRLVLGILILIGVLLAPLFVD